KILVDGGVDTPVLVVGVLRDGEAGLHGRVTVVARLQRKIVGILKIAGRVDGSALDETVRHIVVVLIAQEPAIELGVLFGLGKKKIQALIIAKNSVVEKTKIHFAAAILGEDVAIVRQCLRAAEFVIGQVDGGVSTARDGPEVAL